MEAATTEAALSSNRRSLWRLKNEAMPPRVARQTVPRDSGPFDGETSAGAGVVKGSLL